MTRFISHIHTDLRNTRFTHRGSTHRPEEVAQGLHKEYARFETVPLPTPETLAGSLTDALQRRKSYFGGSSAGIHSLQFFGTLLGSALGTHPGGMRRCYPSGGALYPIETYIITATLPEYGPFVFHYHPTNHALEKLWTTPKHLSLKELVRSPGDLLFSSLIVFTAVWKRSSAKYGDFTYPVALLEAGHMSQNVLLVSTMLGVSVRPMAAFDDMLLLDLLDLDPETEQPVHSIVLSG